MSLRSVVNAAMEPFSKSSKDKAAGVTVPIAEDEDSIGRRPLLTLSVPSTTHTSYGATDVGTSSIRTSPERYRRDSLLGRVPEDAPMDGDVPAEAERDEWDLEERGLYIGSYKQKVMLYTFVPLSSALVFVILSVLPSAIWHSRHVGVPTYSRYFPSPLPEVLVSAALWSLSYLLRFPLFNLCSLIRSPLLQTSLFNTIYVLLSQLLRLSALPILHIRHAMQYPLPTWRDPAFYRVWWVALGWAAADVAVGIAQGYEQLALYREVMVPEERVQDMLVQWRDGHRGSWDRSQTSHHDDLRPRSVEAAVKLAVDKDLEQLVRLRDREELEEIYGMPPIRIPVFVSCLQRIDALVLSVGLTLVIAASYLRSRIAFPDGDVPPIYTNRAFAITFPVVALLHLFLALLHTPPVLRNIGVHSTAYVGLLVGLGSVFAGLALWGALS